MHKLFIDEYKIHFSYKVYWNNFKSKLNIKLGLPNTDTCNFCYSTSQKIADENDVKKVNLEVKKRGKSPSG